MFSLKTLTRKFWGNTGKIDNTDELIRNLAGIILKKEKYTGIQEGFTILKSLDNDKASKYSFVAFCVGRYISDNLFESLHNLIKKGFNAVIYFDESSSTEFVRLKVEQYKKYENVSVVQVNSRCSYAALLLNAFRALSTEYVSVFSFMDKINARSYICRLDNIISGNPDKDIYLPSECVRMELIGRGCFNSNQNWSLSGLSGVTFRRSFIIDSLAEQDKDSNTCLAERLLSRADMNRIHVYEEPYLFNRIVSSSIDAENIVCIVRDVISELESCQYAESAVEQVLERFNIVVRDIFACDLDVFKKAWIFTTVCYVFYLCEIHELDIEKWKQIFCKSLDYCHKLTYRDVYGMVCRILTILVKEKEKDLFIVENIGMEDIKNSRFFEVASGRFSIDYQIKRSYVDYYRLNNLVLKMHSRAAKVTVSSVSLSKDMYYYPDKHITLWHGLGWMKKTVFYPQNYSVGTIICSSKACEEGYKTHFFADEAVGLGCVQTDKLYDENFKSQSRKNVHEKHGIPLDKKIIFFAPTFRMGGKRHYYDFGMDIDALAEKLAEKDLYLITKRHHIFKADIQDTGIDSSGVYNSKNGHFIVDEDHDISELMCSCDCFVTDYSSSMYFAFILNLPMFLYATDIEDYKNGPNGFEIDYPNDVPVPLVDKPVIDDFIAGYYASLKVPNTGEYRKYRDYNVRECDGKVAERVVDFLLLKIGA